MKADLLPTLSRDTVSESVEVRELAIASPPQVANASRSTSPLPLTKSSLMVIVRWAGTLTLYQSESFTLTTRPPIRPAFTRRDCLQESFCSDLSSGPLFRKVLILV